ncbi:Zds-C domain-containing protein [Mycena indigotica]|uniref:Zds-C domain-containing protein n=1 Tax=Mycena indigotica TaxID=2126181 RepID=A0A8H6WEQ9_9AGAR|nr:Zds-C domain-containing protein [Mycena indigotica]KAF7309729.1 Zds-C domain-containing protein [Mycena indigotica]
MSSNSASASATRDADRISSAQQTLDILHEMSQLLNTQLDKETLTTCVRMIESGVNPEALAPTDYDIRREVEALRDIRRRSTTPLTIDPDLPPNQSTASPTNHSTSPDNSPNTDVSDPFHLFWVPAGLHPEIAPQEFRAFLKEHARNPPADDESNGLQRATSLSSGATGLGRKKSMLSRQYQPSENDTANDDTVVPLRRNRSGIYSSNQNQGPHLTISDLQKLEELAEEASTSDDPAKLRNILRRSLSLNVSPLALDEGDLGDEADQPIIVAPPGQFLRRTARTRIRKPGLPGDGGGHRFGERRRGPSGRSATAPGLQRTSSDVSSSDHGESVESFSSRPRISDENAQDRPMSFSEEAQIYDSYVRDDDDDLPPTLPPVLITSSPPSFMTDFPDVTPQVEVEPEPESEPLAQVIHQPQPTRLLAPDPYQQQPQPPSRTPSPAEYEPSVSETHSPSGTPSNSPPSGSFIAPAPSPRKEKDKKGLFGKWGSDKEKEKSSKSSKKDRERADKEQREKESGFFGSLFGKKKQDNQPETTGLHGGREAAQALLGQSQRAPRSPGPPSPMMGPGINNYSRYPIHVERAIYRLSHIKLANPRRPLYEQVLISNLMFWYLGVINKAQTNTQNEQQQAVPATSGPTDAEKERLERERVEREAAAQAEKEKQERERAEREQRERELLESKKREASPRRGSLTKASTGPPQRRAEMPVKGPQYEMQHRVMEKEYAGYNGNGQRPNMAPPVSGYPRQQSPPKQEYNYYSPGETLQSQQQRLPPGAMPPVDQSSWHAGQPPPSRSPPPQRRSRSPPPKQAMPMYNPEGGSGGARLGGRSLSATAVMPVAQPPPMNGKIRKGQSAHAGVPANARRPQNTPPPMTNGGGARGEEEDMPLAMWQQRQQRR